MQNEREQFLRNVSEALGRTALRKNVVKLYWSGDVPDQYLTGWQKEEIVGALNMHVQTLT